MKVQGSTAMDITHMSMDRALEGKDLSVGYDGGMASSSYPSTGNAVQDMSPGHGQVGEEAGGAVDPEYPNDVDRTNKINIASSSITSKTKECTFQENGDIVSDEDKKDHVTIMPSISNVYTMDERPSTQVAPLSEEHICISTNITKEVDKEPPKAKPFVSGYANVAYVPDVPAIEPQVFIIDDGCVQHGSEGTYIRYESQIDKKEGSKQLLRQIVTLLGGCFNVFLGLGFPFSLGALFVDWLEDFQTTRAATASIQSTSTGLTFMGGLVNGFLIQRFGIRAVLCSGSMVSSLGLFASWFATSYTFTLVSIGVVMGCGCSMVYLANNVNVTLAFRDPRAKAFALALMTSSGGLGSMIFPTILQELKREFGWRGALLIMSGIYLNVALSGLLVTSSLGVSPTSRLKNNTNIEATSKFRRLLNPLYGAYLLCGLIGFGSITATVLTAVDFGVSKGLSAETGIMIMLLINGTSTGMRLMAGFIQMIPGVKTYHVFCTSVLVSSTALIVISWADSYGMIMACFSVYGLAAGGMVSTFAIVVFQVVGEDMYAVSMGLGGAVTGASNTTLGILMGKLYDLTGSYDLPFLIFGSMGVSVAFLPVIIQCLKSIGTHKSVTISHQ
ncbi:monocarboxylate transporter 11-like isoform X1 [Haliotis rufescens]|uniref:monocarboxylate transporter 11-like isoform X1 n=1 Tax=Haliotis rufescens TaxID=6454 RepID=UPI001EAF9B30|nr:monocarboxylate transporter 11-like isoform X1 [Haliotis rufescens]